MKTTLGVGISVLSALAAQGKGFDRAELNAMLDKLAASPEPDIKMPLVMATCYVMMMPKDESYEYVCPVCGLKTHYAHDKYRIVKKLDTLRAAAARLKGKGLNVELDERCMCQACGRDIVPTGGEIVKVPTAEPMKSNFCWKAGDKIVISSLDRLHCRFDPANPEYWIYGKYVSPDGELLGSMVRVRTRPDVESAVYAQLSGRNYWHLKVLPRRPGDPAEWVRVEKPVPKNDRSSSCAGRGCFEVYRSYVGNFTYGDRPDYEYDRGRLEWLLWKINGRFCAIQDNDIALLDAFMDQREVFDIDRYRKISLKSCLPRLRRLLQDVSAGIPDAEEGEATKDTKDRRHAFERQGVEVDVEVDI